MKQLLIGTAMVAATALVVFAGSARADVPAAGTTMSFPPSIVCDTKQQIADIAKASAESKGQKFIDKFKEYQALKDAKNEPTCAYQPLQGITLGENVDLGTIYTQSGAAIHGYAVHFGTSQAEGWLLFAEKIETAPNHSSFDFRQWDWTRTRQGV